MNYSAAPEYDSTRDRGTIVGEIRELYRYRDFLKLLVASTIKSRYKRSALGVAWTLLNPLVNMVVMAVAFSSFFRSAVPRYPVYLLIGLTTWGFFSQSTAYAMGQLFWGAGLIKRVHLPPTVFAVACIVNGLVNFALALVPLFAIMLLLRQPIYATWWFFPFAVLILAAFALGVALLVSSLAVLFIDVMDMYQLLLQAWFFLTPVIYPRELVDARFGWWLAFNPMNYMIEIVRMPVFTGHLPSGRTLLIAIGLALGALVVGAWTFTRKADEFAYRI